MPVPPSPAVTPAQQKNIGAAIGAVNTYIAGLLSVENKAADAGDLTKLRQLNGPFQDAVALKQQLVYLESVPLLADLNAAIAAVKLATTTLDKKKTQIDAMVKAVSTAATVLNAIDSVVILVATIR